MNTKRQILKWLIKRAATNFKQPTNFYRRISVAVYQWISTMTRLFYNTVFKGIIRPVNDENRVHTLTDKILTCWSRLLLESGAPWLITVEIILWENSTVAPRCLNKWNCEKWNSFSLSWCEPSSIADVIRLACAKFFLIRLCAGRTLTPLYEKLPTAWKFCRRDIRWDENYVHVKL